jgi:MinD superfamily P-loop ATPase
MIDQIDFHLGQSAAGGNIMDSEVRHGIFVYTSHDTEIAKVDDNTYLLWNGRHDPPGGVAAAQAPPLTKEGQVAQCEKCGRSCEQFAIEDPYAGKLWKCSGCGYKTVRY